MRAMVLNRLGLLRDNPAPLALETLPDPTPGAEYPIDEANQALLDLKDKAIRGAKVLRIA